MLRFRALVFCLLAGTASCGGQTNVIAFSRIFHGWTNYSTAFSTTHDAQANGEYATVATLYTPPFDMRAREFGAIVIWYGTGSQRLDFDSFAFQVGIWSSLQSFVANPRTADLAQFDFDRPTAGNTTVPDAITRGGRPAYELRFDLASANVVLSNCHTYLIGLIAIATQSQAGELFVPTAPFDGPSDVQAGNIVPFGWIYLLNAGGMTIYSGQLATELTVDSLGGLPQVGITRTEGELQVDWGAAPPCFQLETTERLGGEWLPSTANSNRLLRLPPDEPSRFFRLRQIPE